MKSVIAITGASGAIYGKRLLETLSGEKTLIVSDTAREIVRFELGIDIEDLERLADYSYRNDDLFAPISSGSQFFDAMIIAPCSEGTIAKIASGIADTLITRVASVAMKEGRTLILVPRETPVNAVMLENQLKLCRLGVKILPASPAFYHNPKTVDDLVDFVVGKILDQIGETHNLFRRWRA
ncbi:MAG: UbiX family flavin prenyltransferase [Methanomassiliicoccales archaeon]|nr:UbiX family flavin prenyltransferase [Methanomassiliicoccales archaeon]